jgi:hypothetical protein
MWFARLLIASLLLLPAAELSAHRRSAPGNATGIAIAGLSHGEMAVLAPYRGQILDLAKQVKATNPVFRTLLNYSAIEYSYCFWGLAPGTINDEASPFNECAHAYLSATKAVLLQMRDMPEVSERASVLVSDIDAEMVRKGAAFIGCQYSGETFNTAEFLGPHWENLPQHPPTLYALGFGVVILASPLLVRLSIPRRTTSS